MNGRNHNELDWKEIETEHIIIVYHNPLLKEAKQAASLAEETYKQLAKTYNDKPKHKVRIFISNQDDIMNGYCMSNDHIVLWVDQNDFLEHFTGDEKWLRKVISHEMGHYFMYNSVRSWLDNFFPYSAITFPRSFSEGYAMFFSGEKWGQGREDEALKKGVFANNLNEEFTAGYFYATGFSMVRYLAAHYGEEKLIELVKFKDELGIYDFEKAFKKVYHKSFEDFKEEWRRYIYTYYYGKMYEDKELIKAVDSSSSYSINGLNKLAYDFAKINKLKLKNDQILLVGKKDKDQGYLDLIIGKFSRDSIAKSKLSLTDSKYLIKESYFKNIDFSPNGKFVVYSKFQRMEYGSLRKAVYLIDPKTENKDFVGKGDYPVVDNEGNIYFHEFNRDKSCIVQKKATDSKFYKEIISFNPACQIAGITISADGRYLGYAKFDENNQFGFEIYDLIKNSELSSINLAYTPKDIIFSDNKFFFTVESSTDSRKRLFSYDPQNQEQKEYQTPFFNISPVAFIDGQTNEFLVQGFLKRKDNPFGTLKLSVKNKTNTNTIKNEPFKVNFYSKWINTEYKNQISKNPKEAKIIKEGAYNSFTNLSFLMAAPVISTEDFGFLTYAQDPLSLHTITASAFIPYNFDFDDSYYFFNYTNKMFYPILSFDANKLVWIAQIIDEDFYYYNFQDYQLMAHFPNDLIKASFWNFNYGLGVKYSITEKEDPKADIIYEDQENVSFLFDLGLSYNLPYKNSHYHPIRKMSFGYQAEFSDDAYGANYDFLKHNLYAKFGIAPFYGLVDGINDKIAISNKSFFSYLDGSAPMQNYPGTDTYENIYIEDLIQNQVFIRGNDKLIFGKKLFTNNLELYFKISSNFLNSFKILPNFLQFGYFGIGGFLDYASITGLNDESLEMKTYGYEAKIVTRILGIYIENKFGNAYSLDSSEDLGFYYQAVIPLIDVFK